MPDTRRAWTQDDIVKLRNLAGRYRLRNIAAELGRSPGATAVQASKLGISLNTKSVHHYTLRLLQLGR
jgi:hypothetical protein